MKSWMLAKLQRRRGVSTANLECVCASTRRCGWQQFPILSTPPLGPYCLVGSCRRGDMGSGTQQRKFHNWNQSTVPEGRKKKKGKKTRPGSPVREAATRSDCRFFSHREPRRACVSSCGHSPTLFPAGSHASVLTMGAPYTDSDPKNSLSISAKSPCGQQARVQTHTQWGSLWKRWMTFGINCFMPWWFHSPSLLRHNATGLKLKRPHSKVRDQRATLCDVTEGSSKVTYDIHCRRRASFISFLFKNVWRVLESMESFFGSGLSTEG